VNERSNATILWSNSANSSVTVELDLFETPDHFLSGFISPPHINYIHMKKEYKRGLSPPSYS
jgi:hypothetical protein